jgi:hypothetical protein
MANAGHAAMTVFFRMSCAERATGKTFITAIPYHRFTGQGPFSLPRRYTRVLFSLRLIGMTPQNKHCHALYTHVLVKFKDLLLKIVPYPKLHPIIVLFFTELGVSRTGDERRPEAQFPIGEAGIE